MVISVVATDTDSYVGEERLETLVVFRHQVRIG